MFMYTVNIFLVTDKYESLNVYTFYNRIVTENVNYVLYTSTYIIMNNNVLALNETYGE